MYEQQIIDHKLLWMTLKVEYENLFSILQGFSKNCRHDSRATEETSAGAGLPGLLCNLVPITFEPASKIAKSRNKSDIANWI